MQRCAGPDCQTDFKPKRSTARYCSTTCRSRAARAKKVAEQSVEADAEAGKSEHALVRAVRKALTDSDALDTVDGQLALQVARRISHPDTAGISTLSKELRALIVAAKADAPAAPEATPAVVVVPAEDEVDAARRRRAEAREAAGLS